MKPDLDFEMRAEVEEVSNLQDKYDNHVYLEIHEPTFMKKHNVLNFTYKYSFLI